MFGSRTGGMGYPGDGVRQIGGGVKRTGPHDRPRDFSRIAVFPPFPQKIPQLGLGKFVDQLFRRHPGLGIHSHIQGPGLLKTKTPLGLIHLGRGDS